MGSSEGSTSEEMGDFSRSLNRVIDQQTVTHRIGSYAPVPPGGIFPLVSADLGDTVQCSSIEPHRLHPHLENPWDILHPGPSLIIPAIWHTCHFELSS